MPKSLQLNNWKIWKTRQTGKMREFAVNFREISAARPIVVKELKSEEIPDSVRSRGVPDTLDTLRLIEIEG
jgi:hypothetical protein